jgi:hypothetical protein
MGKTGKCCLFKAALAACDCPHVFSLSMRTSSPANRDSAFHIPCNPFAGQQFSFGPTVAIKLIWHKHALKNL